MLGAFAVSLGPLARQAFSSWPGALIPAVVLPAGILFPLAARLARARGRGYVWGVASAVSVLAAGLALRYAVVGMPGPFRVGS
jgi:hypothetical protein